MVAHLFAFFLTIAASNATYEECKRSQRVFRKIRDNGMYTVQKEKWSSRSTLLLKPYVLKLMSTNIILYIWMFTRKMLFQIVLKLGFRVSNFCFHTWECLLLFCNYTFKVFFDRLHLIVFLTVNNASTWYFYWLFKFQNTSLLTKKFPAHLTEVLRVWVYVYCLLAGAN